MNKIKTHRGAYKRFKKTKNGMFKHKQSFLRHILTKKPSKEKRKLRPLKLVHSTHQKTLKSILPNI